jgi:glycosyltransferase involved in cell wall biosynthesis
MTFSNNSETPIFLFTMDITLDGGVERVVVNMSNEFIKYYKQVYVISNFKKNQTIKYKIDPQINLHYIYPDISYELWINSFSLFKKREGILRWIRSIGLTSKLYNYINAVANGKKSILMFHGYGFLAWKKHPNVKTIGVDHSAFPFAKNDYSKILNKVRFRFASYMSRKLDIVTCLTNAELIYWQSIGKPTYVMPNFIFEVPSSIPPFNSRKKIILSMGRMDTNQKGFDRLIIAYAKIADKYPDWRLHIYGSGKLQKDYKKMIEILKMVNYIQIFDFTSNPYEKYKESSIYVMTSYTEGFAMVLIEAMICGLVPVSYENTGTHVIIEDNKSGYLIENGNEKNLLERLEFLMNNPEKLSSMSQLSRENVVNRFSASVIIPQWLHLFNQLIQ